ncbi:MAG: hypothetical protein M2R45_03023 [Verrucomicrobia subdivision 3 bacterium]|nr:hypothetical protein [Limisphaerales bacterium]MCS1415544.1 hypothetical protein [Limisphaerales bacterium]
MQSSDFRSFRFVVGIAWAVVGADSVGAEDLEVSIVREGDAIRVDVPSAKGKRLVLEAQQFINNSPHWNPVLRLNSPEKARAYYDPVCRVKPSRFYRLREAQNGDIPWADNFKLIDVDGIVHELYYHSHIPAIILLAVGESLSSLEPMLPEIQDLKANYGDDVMFWAIHCQPDADRDALKAEADALGIDFPVLLDPSQVVTRNLTPSIFPEVFAVRSLDWTLFYKGALSSEVSTGAGSIRNPYLRNALLQHFANEPIDVELAEGTGDSANLPDLGPISYADDIAPILAKHCTRCHSEGNIGPFAIDGYDAVLQNSLLIKHQVMSGEMPPWHADPRYGRFINETKLSDEEKALLIEWINGGAERGEGEDPLLTASFPAPTEWVLGDPDYVVEIPRQEIPADGVIDYRYLVVKSPVPEDAWLKAAVVIPGDPEVVHHSLVFMISDPTDLFAVQFGLAGFYAGYVPGLDAEFFPEGTGKFLPKGSEFVFQQHYTPNGKTTSDVTKLGLYLAEKKPERQLLTTAAFTTDINIPANHREYQRSATADIQEDSWLFEMSPHMHYRGKRFQFEAHYPDGTSEILLSTPDYHFDWQRMYRLTTPKFLPRGTRIRVSGVFDNSPQNRWNPDPNQQVGFGEQSWDEMFIGYFNFAVTN